jgi:hypothetical protein
MYSELLFKQEREREREGGGREEEGGEKSRQLAALIKYPTGFILN